MLVTGKLEGGMLLSSHCPANVSELADYLLHCVERRILYGRMGLEGLCDDIKVEIDALNGKHPRCATLLFRCSDIYLDSIGFGSLEFYRGGYKTMIFKINLLDVFEREEGGES